MSKTRERTLSSPKSPRDLARAEWEARTIPDPRPGRGTIVQPWRRMDKVSAWIEWGMHDPKTFELKMVMRDKDSKGGAGRPLLEFLKELCDRHGLVMCGNATPAWPHQIGKDVKTEFESIARRYRELGFQVLVFENWQIQRLRYPKAAGVPG